METTSSAKPLKTLRPVLSAELLKSSPRTWAKPGGISSPIPSCVGLALRHFLLPPSAQFSGEYGNCWRGSSRASYQPNPYTPILVPNTNTYQKGVIHLALGAVVNALWDLWSKSLGKPLWKLVADFTPEEFVRCIDFRYITDAITPEEAVKMLQDLEPTKQRRVEDALVNRAVPAYTTSAGIQFLSLRT